MASIKIDKATIRTLADLLKETDLTEIEIAEGDSRIRLSRQAPAIHAAVAAPVAAAPVSAGAPAAPVDDSAALAKHPGAVLSPMVGTAYLQPEPGAPAFVRVGDSVSEGDTLFIIEAMKVMNPIKAPKGGKVTRILISDAQPVEFGEPLMLIE